MGWITDLVGLYGMGAVANSLNKNDVASGGQMTSEAMQATTENLPAYLEMLRLEAPKQALSEQALRDQFAGDAARSQFELADEYLPKYGQIGRDEAYFNKMLGSAADVDVMRGPGGALIDEASAAARAVDPEFYRQRAQTQRGLSDLLRSLYDERTLEGGEMYDKSRPQGYFTGNLSGGEREEINRSLNQQAAQAGNLNVPSMSNVVANAMTYGNAMQNRRNAFGQALSQATSFLPASRSGFDPMQVALGRPTSNSYGSQFSQPNVNSQNVMNQGSNMFNMAGNMATTSAGLQAKQPSTLQSMGQMYNTFPGLQNLSW